MSLVTVEVFLNCRSDFEFIAEDSVHGEAPPINKPSTTAQAADHFQREEIDANVDPVLELHIVSPLQPLLHSSPSDSLLPALPQLPSPVREEGEEGEEMQIDLKPGEGTYILCTCRYCTACYATGSLGYSLSLYT